MPWSPVQMPVSRERRFMSQPTSGQQPAGAVQPHVEAPADHGGIGERARDGRAGAVGQRGVGVQEEQDVAAGGAGARVHLAGPARAAPTASAPTARRATTARLSSSLPPSTTSTSASGLAGDEVGQQAGQVGRLVQRGDDDGEAQRRHSGARNASASYQATARSPVSSVSVMTAMPAMRRRLAAEEPPVVGEDVARLGDPPAHLGGAAAHDDHLGAIGVGVVERGADRQAVVPDVVEHRARRIGAVEQPVGPVRRALPRGRLGGVVAEGDVDARGIVVALARAGVGVDEDVVDLPAPGQPRIGAQIEIERAIERGGGRLAARLEHPALAVAHHAVARVARDS